MRTILYLAWCAVKYFTLFIVDGFWLFLMSIAVFVNHHPIGGLTWAVVMLLLAALTIWTAIRDLKRLGRRTALETLRTSYYVRRLIH